jgi:hypothetical protein
MTWTGFAQSPARSPGVRPSCPAPGRGLCSPGVLHQPLYQAYQQNPEPVRQGEAEEYPATASRSR